MLQGPIGLVTVQPEISLSGLSDPVPGQSIFVCFLYNLAIQMKSFLLIFLFGLPCFVYHCPMCLCVWLCVCMCVSVCVCVHVCPRPNMASRVPRKCARWSVFGVLMRESRRPAAARERKSANVLHMRGIIQNHSSINTKTEDGNAL